MRFRFGAAAFAVLAAFVGCAQPAAVQKLEAVAALPSPAVPRWITSIAPQGTADARTQIRVIFAAPVLPVEQLGSAAEKDVLAHFSIAPALPGAFVVLTPRMIGFQSDAALPGATRVQVTLSAGLRDLRGDVLANDLAWTFETQPLVLSSPSPQTTNGVAGLTPVIQVPANTRVDAASLKDHASFRAGDEFVGVKVAMESPDPDATGATYDISPEHELRAATHYDFSIDQGVLPARGNLPSQSTASATITTYSPLEFAGPKATADPLTSTGRPRFSGGDPVLVFNNALDPKTYAQHVRMQPSPGAAGRQPFALSDDGNTILINPYLLGARTAYTFTIDSGLKDVFGQTLGKDVSATFTTPDYAPYFWAPTGVNAFASSQNLQLVYSALNVPNNSYTARYRVLAPLDLLRTDPGSASDLVSGQTWQQFGINAARNRQVSVTVPLRQQLGGPAGILAYGAGAQTGSDPFYGVVQLTNLGVFAQWFPANGSVMVQRLSDGAPVGGASVDVYRSNVYSNNAPISSTPCASGTTNAGGVVTISGDVMQSCYAGNRPSDEAPELYVVARSGSDWTYVRTYSWSGIYTYSNNLSDSTWSNGQPISRGTIFSDRQMYRPGERGWFTAVCYVLQNGVLRADRNATYSLVLRDPNGNARKLPSQTTNGFATFAFPIDFAKSQALGYYTIEATSPDGAKITGSLRVAEFHPPNFSVDLTLDKEFAAAGDTVNAKGVARYLFGAPMSGNATIHVTRQQAYFTPKGWDDYTFGRQWFWPDQAPDVDSEAGTQTVPLDASGNAAAQITVARDLPYAMTYRVDMETTDVSKLSSSATQSFTAVPSQSLIGLKSDFVGTVNTPINTSVIVTDPSGAAQIGTKVHLELQRMDYSSVTQVVEGSENARNQVQYTTVSQADVVSGNTPATVTLQTKDSGSYRIRASLAGATESADTDTMVWVTGPGQAQWAQNNASQLQLKLDKKTYAIGDTATIAVASPYNKADLYLSVIRDRVLWHTLVHVNGSAPRVKIPINESMFPNAAVQGVLVRRGAPLSSTNATNVSSLVQIGLVPLAVDIRPQYLRVTIDSTQARLAPGAQQTVRFHVTGTSGNAARSQLTVIVADDAVLRLSGYRPPDLVTTVLQDQPISTRFGDSRPDITLLQPSDVAQKGWGYGGGFLAGAASTTIRTNFVPLAFFKGAVLTNGNGDASVTFKVPDNLTTWRVMAVAVTSDSRPRFGTNDGTFITTKPLVTQPLMPQFARPGDRFDGGVLVMNSGTSAFDARTQGVVTGVLSFTSPAGTTAQAQQQFGPGLNAWRFGMTVTSAGAATTQFTTAAAGASDAFRVPFTVRTADVSESTIDDGATATAVQIPLVVGKTPGSVHVTVAGSLVAEASAAANRIASGDRDDFLSSDAARLRIAAALTVMQTRLGKAAVPLNAAQIASQNIDAIARLQRSDGGFRFWPSDSSGSDAFGSAGALYALAYAANSGIAISPHMLANAKAYAARALADPATAAKWCTDQTCKNSLRFAMLRALAETGDVRTDFLAQIFDGRANFSLAQRAQLAVLLQQSPGWSAQAATVTNEIAKDVYITGRYQNVQAENIWDGTPAQGQAAYLQLLIARNAPDAAQDGALHALLAQECKCGWSGTGDTADALEALATYTQAHATPPNFTAQITVDGKVQKSVQFTSLAAPAQTIDLNLAAGNHTVALSKNGTGTLHYVVAYDYRLGADAPGRLAGLRVRRTVRAVNAPAILTAFDIAPQAEPFSVAAGNVYDIGIDVITDHPVDRVVITDPLPAGFEALDTSFQTTAAYYQPLASDWAIDYQQIYTDRIVAFAQHLNAGVYTLHYLARSVTPGDYIWPGTSAYLLNAPEQFGRSAFGTLHVTL